MNFLSNKKSLIAVLIAAVIGVTLIPTIYSSIYLGAFWDPYSRLGKVPVAFVNSDKSVTRDGKEYSIGKDLEENLKKNHKVAWKFVSYKKAREGVEGSKYYAMIEIPKDFSQRLADSQSGKFNNPQIIYKANRGKNYIFSQISERVAESIKSEISQTIDKEISKALVDNLYNVKGSIKQVGNGVGQLQTGTRKLLSGSKELSSNLDKAAEGSAQLVGGLKDAREGAVKLDEGTEKLVDGSEELSKGLSTAATGSEKLRSGLKAVKDNQAKIVEGSTRLVEGLNTFKSSLSNSNDQIPVLVKGASDVNIYTSLIEKGAEKLNNSLNSGLTSAADGINQAAGGISQADSILNDEIKAIQNSNMSQEDKAKVLAAISVIHKVNSSDMSTNIEAPLRKASISAQPLLTNLKDLSKGTKQVSDGVGQLASGISESQKKAASGVNQLISGAQGIQNGSSRILEGLNTIFDKSGELSSGLEKLSGGASSINNGLAIVNRGADSLKKGLNTAVKKTGTLSTGLRQMSEGSNKLTNGLKESNDGTGKLEDGLKNGYTEIDNKLKFNAKDMSLFVTNPVNIKDKSINNVKYYGEGLAPYFISLSLWLGAMLMNLLLSIIKRLDVIKNKLFYKFAGNFAAGAVLVMAQSIILSFVLIKFLNIDLTSTPNFYLTNAFISLVFFSVMYGVSHALGLVGTPIMFIVFLLQLSSSGGTFPIETAPKFYRVVGEFIPMSYSINMLRMIIAGINSAVIHRDIVIMAAFIVVFLGGGYGLKIIIDFIKGRKNQINNSDARERIVA